MTDEIEKRIGVLSAAIGCLYEARVILSTADFPQDGFEGLADTVMLDTANALKDLHAELAYWTEKKKKGEEVEFENRQLDHYFGSVDEVQCTNCDFGGLVPAGEDACPKCGEECLMWKEKEDEEDGAAA